MPLPGASSASAAPALASKAAAAAPISSRLARFIASSCLLVVLTPLSGRTRPVEFLLEPDGPVAREESADAMGLLHPEVEDDRDEKHQALDRAHPGARQTCRHQPGLDHADDEAAEDGADDRRAPAEDRGAADQHRRDGGEQVALPLIAEEVLVLQGQQHGRERGEAAHQGEEPDLLPRHIDADDPRDGVGIADEEHMLAEAMAVQDEPEKNDD